MQPRATNTQKKESKKRAKTAKEHSENQSNKRSNGNRTTICGQKNATSAKKTQGKHRTPAKNKYQRKTKLVQTAKARKGAITAKQHNAANLDTPQVQRQDNFFFFGFSFKKKINQSIFFKNKIATLLLVEKIGTIVLTPLHWTLNTI